MNECAYTGMDAVIGLCLFGFGCFIGMIGICVIVISGNITEMEREGFMGDQNNE